MKKILISFVISFLCVVTIAQERFSFAFLTDIHLSNDPKDRSFEGLGQAVGSAKNAGIDFIITGGDNMWIDRLGKDEKDKAEELYTKYKNLTEVSSLKWYITIGNHDRYWHDKGTGNKYGESLFTSFFGNTYYTFDHKGWRFIILNTTEVCNKKYCVSNEQMQWLKGVLDNTPADEPIVVSVHVPFLSLYYPVLEGKYTDDDTFINQKEVLDMFERYNLKLVLQGHQHLYEEIKIKGIQFITGGAVCAAWWDGAFHGTEEGYLLVHLEGDDFSWEYVDYGWEVKK